MLSSSRGVYNPNLFPYWVASLFGAALVSVGMLLATQVAGMPMWLALTCGLALFGTVGLAYVLLFWGKIGELPYIPFHLAPPTKFCGAMTEVPVFGWITDRGDGVHFTVNDTGAIVCAQLVLATVQAWFDDDPYPADKPVRVMFWR